ncbi:MAG: TlpA disulfide reductase family protein [Candidatus Puniceispirillaceae bacterium]
MPAQALLGLAMLLAVPLAGAADTAPAPPAREAAPPMLSQIVDETSAAYTMAEMQGGPVLVNFWATWCAPCIAELPALSRAATALADDGVTVLLVSIDRGGAARALPFLETHGVSGVKLGFDPKAKLSRETGVRGLPTTLLLDSAQGSAWRFIGPFEWDDPAMLGVIRGLLAD